MSLSVSKRLNVILIGAGRVAKHYSEIFHKYSSELSNLEIVGVIDPKRNNAKDLAAELNCEHFPDFESFTEKSNADLCLVLTPSHTHFSVAKTALEHGLNTVVEKPSTLLLADSIELNEIASKQKLYLATIHQNRYNNAVVFAKSVIERKLLGSIVSISIRLIWHRPQSYYEDEWHGRWESDGGVVSQQAFHHLDIARHLCGQVKRVSSFGDSLGHKIQVDDTSVGIMKFEGGALGTFELTTSAPKRDREASIRIVGTQGILSVGGVALNKIIEFETNSDDSSVNFEFERFSEEFHTGYGLSHYRVLKEIYGDLCGGKRNYVPWEDSVETLKLVHAIYSSQENQAVAELAEVPQSSRLGLN